MSVSIIPGTWFPSAALLASPLLSAAPTRLPIVDLRSLPTVSADTTPAVEPPLVPLTEELTQRYGAVRQEVFAFIQAHPAVITARIPVHVYTLTMRGPGGGTQGHSQVGLVDFAALAAQTPAVAAIFTKHHFPPVQFVPVTITLRKALFAAALQESQRWAIKDPASVAGKNIIFVEAHAKEFVGSPLATTELDP